MLSNNLSDISDNSLSIEHWIYIGFCRSLPGCCYRVLWVDVYCVYLADNSRLLFVLLLVWSQGLSHCFALKINAIIICLRSVLERKISTSKCCRGGWIAVSLHGHNSLLRSMIWPTITVLIDSWSMKKHAVTSNIFGHWSHTY